jgi:hypothetical protein
MGPAESGRVHAMQRASRACLLLLMGAVSLGSRADPPRSACVPFVAARSPRETPGLRLRGGSAAIWAAIEDADSESDRERLRNDPAASDGANPLRDFDMENLLRDYAGKTAWEKLKSFVGALQANYGEEEIDNVDVDEFGWVWNGRVVPAVSCRLQQGKQQEPSVEAS